ncbi:hypothetical protein WICPIJ_004698 [Wickerhamomyces pijperi]|uniref:Uncharacterized protein n=1 Tax=Wickerhamomyces pijperi TaxID=599730 RepID=A0A9P8TLS9_WICPI|nr:hypothetical protein WICPIJ_004698 [Wickerhamomyces pijperi]
MRESSVSFLSSSFSVSVPVISKSSSISPLFPLSDLPIFLSADSKSLSFVDAAFSPASLLDFLLGAGGASAFFSFLTLGVRGFAALARGLVAFFSSSV